MKNKQYLAYLVILAMVVLLIACDGSFLVNQNQDETALPSPSVIIASDDLEEGEEISTQSISTSTATNEPVVPEETDVSIVSSTPTPTPITNTPFALPSPTSSPQSKVTPDTQVTKISDASQQSSTPSPSEKELQQPKIIKPTGGVLKLDLELSDDVLSLASTISKVIYTSSEPPAWSSSSIWIADAQDVTQKTELITFSEQEGFPYNAIVSPSGNWVAYALYRDRPGFEGVLQVLNIKTKEQILLDSNVFVRLHGGKTIVWSSDSSTLAYITVLGEIYLVQVDNYQSQKQLLVRLDDRPFLESNKDYVLVGWSLKNQLFYAIKENGAQWYLKMVNLETGHTEEVGAFDKWDLTDASLSPDGDKVLLSLNSCYLINLNSAMQKKGDILAADFSCGLYPVWWPDSQGVLASYRDSNIFAVNLSLEDDSPANQSTRHKIEVPIPSSGLILAWSPDGRYLVYEDNSDTEKWLEWLVDVGSGQKQLIPDNVLEIAGWIR